MKLPPIAIGAAAGLLLALRLAPPTGTALGQLSAARAERDRLAALAKQPAEDAALVAPGLALGVADQAAGRAAIMLRVRQLAKAGGVLVEETSAVPTPDALAAVRVRVSGQEKAVLALADALERARQMVRLRGWRVEPIEGGVRLIGEAVAAWR